MAARPDVTTADVYEQIAVFIEQARDQEAIDYWLEFGLPLLDEFPDDQLSVLLGVLASAELSVRLQKMSAEPWAESPAK